MTVLPDDAGRQDGPQPGFPTERRVPAHRRTRLRKVAGVALTTSALLLVWLALVAPSRLDGLEPSMLVHLPLEAIVVVALVLVLPRRAGLVLAVIVGVALGLIAIVKVLDTGFLVALGRPFNPTVDVTYIGSAIALLGDTVGRTKGIVITVVACLAALAMLVLTPLAAVRLTRVVRRHRRTSSRVVSVVAVAWLVSAALGLQLTPGVTVASTDAAGLAADEARQVYAGIQDQQAFAAAVADDPYASAPASGLLTGLRGKDVLIVFVESYGRVAVQGSSFSGQVDSVLTSGTRRLAAAGFASRSAFLTSPTYGGISWLAHSTLESGLWVNSQPRYDGLMTTSRFTLSAAFKRAGWRTVADVPPNDRAWPEGTSFYGYDAIYDSRNVGYAGPAFSYATVPDQYTLAALRRLELARRDRAPVMAEIDLVSSHTPWTPLPHLVPWSRLGDGSVYDGMPAQGLPPSVVWRDPHQVQAMYGQSIRYSLSSIISFVETYHDPNLVLVVLGDHQPASIVSGDTTNRDVPVTIIAHDPKVMSQIASWHWESGMLPSPGAPVWKMDSFRDRFLSAYGAQPRLSTTP